MLFFEDFRAGQVFELGEWTVTEEEIVEFAREWDPQYFHVDPEAAASGPFGGLIASGWHTASIWMRLYVDAVLGRTAGRGGAGVEELSWSVPTRPGDTVRGRLLILETWPSSHRADRGTLTYEGELRNERGEPAMRMRGRGYVARREGA